ncbi:hypothetical protein BTO06_12120 [Tenacibaculum sp. SZ-18]|uniref:hypothetical protein n=1 Tax=Tenacibaculum sp. SZ-18 TaxID=754423 RepID=UPI000C2D28A9|nr:hypothetical protein [Tenacibaculum sp. SZ-18]AUC15850.1 hypothetical protein BTO06_12120 [Tenacibaculum sp. SZ-18]
MNKVKIDNGFYNQGQEGLLLTGILLSGKVQKNDILILNDIDRIPIIEVEFDENTFPGTIHVRLMVSRDHDIIWHKLYGKEYKIDSTKRH